MPFPARHRTMLLKKVMFSFPLESHTAYARLSNTISDRLDEFTICHWTRVRNVSNFGAIFSYDSTNEYDNELLSVITSRGANKLYHRDYSVETTGATPFQEWAHHCATWSASTRNFQLYQNGKQVPNAIVGGEPHINSVIPGGVAIIGQDQDMVGGKLDAKQSFNGDITEVHLWDHVLNPDQINRLSKCQEKTLEGNVISWRQSNFTFSGSVVMSPVNLCEEKCQT